MESVACRTQSRAAGIARNRRRRYIINPGFQWRVVLTAALFVFLACSIISSVLYGLLHAQARARFMDPENYTAQVPFVVIGFALAFSLVAATGVGAWCILLTHRICGPLAVMGRWMEELAAGRTPQLRPFRTSDEFKDFQESFSGAVEALTRRRAQALKAVSEMLAQAETAGTDEQRAAASASIPRELRALQDLLTGAG